MTIAPSFDPRQIPVVGVDNHLPKVDARQLRPDALAARFASPPWWTPELVAEPRFTSRAPVRASVLIGLVVRDHLSVLLTQRTHHLSSHSGQIAFPGGKADPHDRDVVATALREAHEEIGLHANQVQVLGQLPVYTTGSAYWVTPVVALVQDGFELLRNPFEVEEVFEIPLDFLVDPGNHRRHVVQWEGSTREWFSIPYLDGGTERFVWGATAGMVRNLYRFLIA